MEVHRPARSSLSKRIQGGVGGEQERKERGQGPNGRVLGPAVKRGKSRNREIDVRVCRMLSPGPIVMIGRAVPSREEYSPGSAWGQGFQPGLQELHRLLIEPVEARIRADTALRIDTLLISADDVLRYLPFAVLHDRQSGPAIRPGLLLPVASTMSFHPGWPKSGLAEAVKPALEIAAVEPKALHRKAALAQR